MKGVILSEIRGGIQWFRPLPEMCAVSGIEVLFPKEFYCIGTDSMEQRTLWEAIVSGILGFPDIVHYLVSKQNTKFRNLNIFQT
jgi:hypothetical protein